MEGNSP